MKKIKLSICINNIEANSIFWMFTSYTSQINFCNSRNPNDNEFINIDDSLWCYSPARYHKSEILCG
jgi:hypothetical protein